MTHNRVHGLTSLGLVGIAIGIAAAVLFQTTFALGLLYLGITVASATAVLYAYCAKCPCKVHCGHVLPGLAAKRFQRRPGPYSTLELGAMLLALLVLFAFPQVWLWSHTALFIIFWALSGVALVDIRRYVCRACTNAFCPLNRAAQKSAV
jgi:hypothetical protein